MAFAYGSADSLAWLFAGSVFDGDVGSLIRPSILLVASGFEDALIDEYEMSVLLLNLLDFLI